MNSLTKVVSLALAAAMGMVCHAESIAWPEHEDYEAKQRSDIVGATPETEWVGFYEGTGSVELWDPAESYSDLPICVETWLEAGRLRGVVYIQMVPAPGALIEISDGRYSDDPNELCGGTGVTMTVATWTSWVTSSDNVTLFGPDNLSSGDKKRQSLELEREGDELAGVLMVFRYTFGSYDYTGPYTGPVVARLSLQLTKVN